VQYDPPDEPKVLFILLFINQHPFSIAPYTLMYFVTFILYCYQEYIHRVGRTARGEGGKGNALLFLIPEELQFLRYLKVSFSHLTMD